MRRASTETPMSVKRGAKFVKNIIYKKTQKKPQKIYIVIYRMCMCCMTKAKKPKTVKKAGKRAKKSKK